jgi:hypothetical protein
MLLAKLIVQAQFSVPPSALNPQFLVAEALGNPTVKKDVAAQSPNRPVIERYLFNIKEDNILFGVDRTNAGVDVNWPQSDSAASALAIAYLDRVHRAIRFPQLSRFGVRTLWVQPVDMPFAELVSTLKSRWHAKQALIQEASDIALSLTLDDRGHRVNFNLGPIRPDEYPKWQITEPKDKVGDVLLLVDIDYGYADIGVHDALRLPTVSRAVDYARRTAAHTLESTIELGSKS